MRRHDWLVGITSGFMLWLLLLGGRAAYAQPTPIVTSTPVTLTLTGALPDGLFAGSLQLHTSAAITNVRILVSDLQDVTGDQRQRDPMPANAITLLPAATFDTLAADALTQLTVQAAKPLAAGVYSGTLTVRWTQPAHGQLVIPLRLVARTKAALAWQTSANPAEIVFNSSTGANSARQLLLRETSGGAPLTALQPLPQDLVEINNQQVLPASALTVALSSHQIAAGGLLTATLHVQLAGVPPGEYKGALLFSAQPDALVTLPVTIRIRHGWFWPTVVVIIGVLLGLWISSYVARGKVRDEYVVRLAAIREAIQADDELRSDQTPPNGFTEDLTQIIVEAEAAVRAADWTLAEEKAKAATALLVKWQGNRTNWVTQIHYLRDPLLAKVMAEKQAYNTLEETPLTVRKLWQDAVDLLTGVAKLDSPQALQKAVTTLEETLAYFQAYQRQLVALGETRLKVAPNDADLATQWQQLDQSFHTQDLSQVELRNKLGEALTAFRDRLAQVPGQPRGLESTAAGLGAASFIEFPAVLAPALKTITPQEAAAAEQRLEFYRWVTYLVGGLLLSAVGLNTLYVNNPTFGAHWLADYLSLLVFGLGAETTFASVADMLRRWGVPMGQ